MPHKLSPHEIRRVAVLAACDPRSVVRVLQNAPVRSTTVARVHAALRDLGHGALLSDSQEVERPDSSSAE